MNKQHQRANKDKIAPGIDTDEALNQRASKKDISNGDSTKVVTLSLDETDPS